MTRIAIDTLGGVKTLNSGEMQATVGGIVAPTPGQIPTIKKRVCIFLPFPKPRFKCFFVKVPNPNVRF